MNRTFVVVCATSCVVVGVLECTKYICLAFFWVLLWFVFNPHLQFELSMLLAILGILGLKLYV